MRSRPPHAFTLIELLVVIGIIGVLLAILLPVVASVQRSARGVKCMANMRTIHQLLMIYVAESKGSFPWGAVGDRHTETGDYLPPYTVKDWTSVVSGVANRSRAARDLSFQVRPSIVVYRNRGAFLKCPEVDAETFNAASDYQIHTVICPSLQLEQYGYDNVSMSPFAGGSGVMKRWKVAPARMTDLYPDNAILWDTPPLASTQIIPSQQAYLVGAMPEWSPVSYIDGSLLVYPTITAQRYRDAGPDPLIDDDHYRQSDPIFIGPDDPSRNFRFDQDIVEAASSFRLGYPRFRHANGRTCNVLFADGSVRALSWDHTRNTESKKTPTGGVMNEFLRKYLMIKWPSGVPFIAP